MNRKPLRILELTFAGLTAELKQRYGKGKYHAAAGYREVYRNGNPDFSAAYEFSKSEKLLSELKKDLVFHLGQVVGEKKEENLVKFITRLEDGLEIESVIIPMATHKTICVSTQIGCRMGCSFCETAQLGFRRSLTVAEIVGQVYTAKFVFGLDVRNIVFMGMGEPLDNFENLIQAIRVMEDPRGLDIALSHMTVSTVGKVKGIRRLAALNWPRLNLAISLNAPNNRIRSKIMPVNRTDSMDQIKSALLKYPLKKKGTFFIEYVLIKDVNDSHKHAHELAQFLKPLPTKLNLIPYNPRSNSPFQPPSDEDLDRFCGWLVDEKLFVRRRSAKGRGILAGCGQLGNRQVLRLPDKENRMK